MHLCCVWWGWDRVVERVGLLAGQATEVVTEVVSWEVGDCRS